MPVKILLPAAREWLAVGQGRSGNVTRKLHYNPHVAARDLSKDDSRRKENRDFGSGRDRICCRSWKNKNINPKTVITVNSYLK